MAARYTWIGFTLLMFCCQTLPKETIREPRWTYIPAANDQGALAHSQCAAIHGNFVAFGGVDDSKGSPLNSQITLFDSKDRSWHIVDGAQNPLPRNFASFAVQGQSVFIFGGESAHSNANVDTFSFDTISKKWMELPRHTRLHPRKQATLTPVGSDLILFGGKGPAPVSNWGRYDPRNQKWTVYEQKPELTSRVSHIALAVDDENLFIWGGFAGEEKRGDGFILNSRTGEVMSIPHNSVLSPRANARAIRMKEEVLIWGGASTDGNFNSGAAFHLRNQSWRSLPPIPDPAFQNLKGSEMAVWDDKGFLIFGGRFGSERFNDQIWSFDVATNSWSLLRTNESPEGRMGHCFLALKPGFFAVLGGIGYERGSESLAQFDGLWILEL